MRRLVGGTETHAYSAAVVTRSGVAFLAGHGPLIDGEPMLGTIEEQTTLTLENVARTIEALGGGVGDIARCNCFLSSIDDFDRFDAAYGAFFGEVVPARTTVEARLYGGIAVEIEAVVDLPDTD